jgi:hypothetical protein
MLVSPAFKNAIKNGCAMAVLVEVEHPDGTGYFWDGVGLLEFEGNEYKGAGMVGGISQTRKSAELRIEEVTLWVNALDTEEVESLQDNVKNRLCTIRLAVLNKSRRVVDSFIADEILLDYQQDFIDASGGARLELRGQSGFWVLERSTDAAYSQEELVRDYPDETGLSMIPSLKNKDTAWTKT